mmetsp:Transcript_27403/g.43548  ORF Transcript_27403/g.43548 Transcript_27403/m.43548 type:complete len:86 (+) Transcript_27403:253-510(+)
MDSCWETAMDFRCKMLTLTKLLLPQYICLDNARARLVLEESLVLLRMFQEKSLSIELSSRTVMRRAYLNLSLDFGWLDVQNTATY